MNLLTELYGKTKEQLIREMPASNVLDLAFTAYERYLKLRTKKSLEEYNWWVDAYNFKRGKRILKTILWPTYQLRFEKEYAEHLHP